MNLQRNTISLVVLSETHIVMPAVYFEKSNIYKMVCFCQKYILWKTHKTSALNSGWVMGWEGGGRGLGARNGHPELLLRVLGGGGGEGGGGGTPTQHSEPKFWVSEAPPHPPGTRIRTSGWPSPVPFLSPYAYIYI